METKISYVNKEILDVLSHCEEQYILVVFPDENLCHWTENSMSCLDIGLVDASLSDLWEGLVHPDDQEDFCSQYQSLKEGRRNKMSGAYRFRTRVGIYQRFQCDIWTVSPDSPDARLCLAGRLSDADGPRRTDPVTGFLCCSEFQHALACFVSQVVPCAVMMIGIDNFKVFNELYSYSFGNRVLCRCADTLRKALPDHCSLFRSDGDGFYIIFTQIGLPRIRAWFREVQDAMRKPAEIDGITVCFTISAGLCRFPEDGGDADELYRNTVLALQSAKYDGKGRMASYSKDLGSRIRSQSKLLACLRESVAAGFQGFTMYYQPLMDSRTCTLAGCEALLRWEHPDFPNLSIETCVDCLEENGLIKEVGDWILETSIRQCASWSRFIPDFNMNINVSCRQFENPDFKFTVLKYLDAYHVNPHHIVLELTESGRVKDFEVVEDVFDFLRSQRIRIAFDDFGTGYASLDIFRKLSADELKIDRSFLERITYDVTDQALITTLISLCHSMNMTVCVEGIETEELETVIRQMNPDFLQGYHYDRPITAEAFEGKYFMGGSARKPQASPGVSPEWENSMAYSAFSPAQPLRNEDIINHAYAGIFQVGMDQEFSFLTCNEGYRRMLGYTAAEIESKFKNHALGFVHPDDIEYVNEEIRRQLGEGDTVTIEFRVVQKDGTAIWIFGTGNVYRSPNGSSSLIVVILNQDKIKRLQLAQLREYRMCRKLLDSLPTGIKMVRYDPDFTIDYISPGFLKIIGYTEEDIRDTFGGKYINLIHPEDREAVFNDIMEQLQNGDVVTMHYRTPCKDGGAIWVETVSRLCPPDEDGISRACSSVVDVSRFSPSKPLETNRGFNIANRYESMATQWGEYLFELNLKTDSVSFSANFNERFGIAPQLALPDALELVYQEDRPAIVAAVRRCREGKTPEPMELRADMANGGPRWFSFVFSSPELIGGVPVSVVGKFTDVDKERRERDQLVLQAQLDPLTGVLNKSSTEATIRKVLLGHPDSRFALFMLDVDGFKQINDSLGHFSGDEVLRRLASVLQTVFGQEDILGRVGGDEFMVLIRCDMGREKAMHQAEEILKAVRRGDGAQAGVTVSIGISFYPQNGTGFYDLFRSADSALYRAKKLGRNQYCLAIQ